MFLKHLIILNKVNNIRQISSSTASITKIHRATYQRTYPTLLVLADGSTINIRYHEPRQIIQLPLDLNTLTEAERKLRIDKRKPKQRIRIEENIEDSFNSKKYLKYLKR